MSVRSELTVDSRVEEISRARRWLAGHAAAEGFPEAEVRRLGLAVSEACANVVEHAYDGKPGNPVELRLSIDGEKLVLEVRDRGRPFDLEAYEPPDLDEPHEGGYGVFLIRSIMDEVRYEPSGASGASGASGGGTTLTMVRYRDDRGGAQATGGPA